MDIRKPAEWEKQDAVMIAWPHSGTDWSDAMRRIIPVYKSLAQIIASRQILWILCHEESAVKTDLGKTDLSNIRFIKIPFNDTWVRDYGPFVIYEHDMPALLDYQFNGWGGKYEAELDNRVLSVLYERGYFSEHTLYRNRLDFVLEGGAIETDGRGLMMATERSILSSGRNAVCGMETVALRMKNDMGIKKIHWLHNGWMEGDDTDGHIDMFARFADPETICYVRCEDEKDLHFPVLNKMEEEMQDIRGVDDSPFRLLPLPMPEPVYSSTGSRLPASYANFLIMNDAVIMPFYGCRADGEAREVLSEAFPGREITGIDAMPLIEQGGSVHCATMQLPAGVVV